jgi:hypothetical protein
MSWADACSSALIQRRSMSMAGSAVRARKRARWWLTSAIAVSSVSAA